ncbi:UDP-N-acetylglucosamine 1-carboxyvinyltransferase [candidate division WOR-3 bacterium]|nr:UDP-N-acetylglucosamine 1-carboxyvinyltransferase [candidate division WOR-3 bacterium]
MKKFVIEGGHRLEGEVKISGSKNACLPIMAATLLAPGKHLLHGVPKLGDVYTMIKILRVTGASVEFKDHTLIIDTGEINNPKVPYELVSKMRASFLITGALLGRLGEAYVARPGGCAIGPRPIDEHLHGFEMLGIEIKEEHGYINAQMGNRQLAQNNVEIHLNEQSVTATENILLASATAKGETHIINGAREPHIIELINFLNLAGAEIEIKDDIIVVHKTGDSLHPLEYEISADYIEVGTFMIGTTITSGDVSLIGAKWEDSRALITKLQEMGVEVEKTNNGIRVKTNGSYNSCSIKTAPYPGFPTDLQPQLTSLLALADGTSVVTETMFEQRFNHIPELIRMGAQVEVDGRSAVINGVQKLSGAQVMASDIRGGVALVLAGLVAKGRTEVSRIYHIDRGYEELEVKLETLGAEINRES